MTQLALVATRDGTLVPSTQIDREALRRMKVKTGDVLTANFRLARNAKHHRLVFALLRFVFESQERYRTEEELRQALTLRTSFVTMITTLGGRTQKVARSWRFDQMDEADFEKLHGELVEVILGEFYESMTEEELADSVAQQNFLDGVASFESYDSPDKQLRRSA